MLRLWRVHPLSAMLCSQGGGRGWGKPALSFGGLCFVFGLTGCTGRTLEGRWVGEMPLNGAKSCQVKLHKSGAFEFACAAPGNWVGRGTFFYDGHRLRLDYQLVTRPDGTSRSNPSPVSMKVGGATGNVLRLETQDGHYFEWKRRVD